MIPVSPRVSYIAGWYPVSGRLTNFVEGHPAEVNVVDVYDL